MRCVGLITRLSEGIDCPYFGVEAKAFRGSGDIIDMILRSLPQGLLVI